MQAEIEVKFLNVDHDEIRAKLKELGGTLEHPMRLMRRTMLDYPDRRFQKESNHRRLRVRDEGDKITVTYKQRNDTSYAYEIETTVDSYDGMVQLFEAIELVQFSFQESKRETWHYKDVEVVLDEWPWLDTYIEVEGPTEESIKGVAADLGFDWRDAHFGSVDAVYRLQYPGMTKAESIGNVSEVRFGEPLPEFLKEREKK